MNKNSLRTHIYDLVESMFALGIKRVQSHDPIADLVSFQ